jgi:nucleoside-diphosphate-sugar epimerase
MLSRAVVTGSSGFVGRALCARLASVDRLSLGAADWQARIAATALEGATVFHLAARVHDTGDERAFVADNVDKTRALAEAAVREGSRRLVFVSTIKVHGEESPGRALREEDVPAPADAYGRSKLAAEEALHGTARESGLEVVIVRPPLVYGGGARANLEALVRLCDTPWPLPFAALHAQRSFVHVDDLVRLLVDCAEHPRAAGKTFLAAHPAGVSTSMLVAGIRRALGRPPRMFSVPPPVLEAAAAAVGQGDRARRLTRALLADPGAAQRELQWTARVPIDQAIEEVVRDYRARHPH